jgi:hypothetical protein
MRLIFLILFIYSNLSFSQGTCLSPDGAMLSITSPPASYQYLEDNGYCMNGTGSTKWHDMCFTFTPTKTEVDLNLGYSSSCMIVQVDNVLTQLYDNTCTSVGSGFTFTGVTPGNLYTWCVRMKSSGGPGCNGFDRVCPYYIESDAILPIKLLTLSCQDGTITWQTATEINNDYYTIYSSEDIYNWESKVVVDGAGNKGTVTTYQYTDYKCMGDTYYKLEQTDYDGESTEVGIVYCKCDYYKPQEYIIEEYNILGQSSYGHRGWKILKIKKGNRIIYEKIYSK